MLRHKYVGLALPAYQLDCNNINMNDTDKKPEEENEAKLNEKPKEIGGPKGAEPTRFGDWEVAGRCSDF